MHPLLTDIKHIALDTLFPITCLCCDTPGDFTCERCLQKLVRLSPQRCMVCQKAALHGITHKSCQSAVTPDGCLSVFDYHDEDIADILIQAKYKFLPSAYNRFGHAVADFISAEHMQEYFKTYVVCPIPLHKNRLRWRGFNQADILGKTVSERLSLSFEPLLSRVRSTKTQKDLDKKARGNNMAEAFGLHHDKTDYQARILDWFFDYSKPPRLKISVRNKNVLLIDDVITTGSTLLEATKILKQNGAHSVWCVTVARD
jgi:competence protein ComFC